MLSISSIPALTDNYIWLIKNDDNHCVIVDPGEAYPVLERLKSQNLILDAILLTHHHQDHIGGVESLTRHFPSLAVYGPRSRQIPQVTHPIADRESFTLLKTQFTLYAVPGHTLDHVFFYTNGSLFCGDTLFSAGCGRLFEGTPEQMHNSLSLIASFPEETNIYCAHEYTLANLKFAQAVEPNNAVLKNYAKKIETMRANGECSLPSTIAIEKSINPFLRTHEATIKAAVSKRTHTHSDIDTFAALRRWKDEF